MNIHQVLKQYYGYDQFREGQEDIIRHIMNQRDVLAIMPTGAGKSICYQIPSLLLPGITIVISPLISLMNDQVSALTQQGIKAAFINGSLSTPQYFKVLSNLKQKRYQIVYVAPERLENASFLETIRDLEISMISIDEAHCVSQWGHDFRPSYLKIHDFLSSFEKRPIVSAFTATATKQVKEDIIQLLKLHNPYSITTGFNRENLYFEVQEPKDKSSALLSCLTRFPDKSGIIYCNTRKAVDQVHEQLLKHNYQATRYHAGLSDQERTTNQDDFLYDRKTVMVATNAFGMGIDKSNVSYVIHYNMPKNMESYYQEAGRAGRDGEEATCILLYGSKDVITNKFLIEHSNEENEPLDPARIQLELEKLKQMTFYAHSKECLRAAILRYFGESPKPYCGKCSVCDTNYEEQDITVASQKILSCVYRMNQSYGMRLVSDVLRGSNTEKIRNLGFDKLSTYGLLSHVSADVIREMMRFLISEDYLIQTEDEYPILTLGSKAAMILKGEQSLTMKMMKQRPTSKPATSSAEEDKLLSALKKLRLELAKQQNVPAYIIFTDATLHIMAKQAPQTLSQLNEIPGVGHVKINKYGKQFLEVIANIMG